MGVLLKITASKVVLSQPRPHSPTKNLPFDSLCVYDCSWPPRTYQRAGGNGFHHGIEHVDRQSQQSGSTIDYGFIHVVLRDRVRRKNRACYCWDPQTTLTEQAVVWSGVMTLLLEGLTNTPVISLQTTIRFFFSIQRIFTVSRGQFWRSITCIRETYCTYQ